MRDEPARVLTRHFFGAFFDFGFLSEEGSQSVERVLLGSSAVAIGIGLLLVRVFVGKYAFLAGASPDLYLAAVAADHAFLIALPMWIVAAAVALVGHALFPDETDFRILMAEPLSRGTIFGAKLAALLLFLGLFVAGSHVALAPLSVMTLVGPAGAGSFAARAAAFAFATLAGSATAALSMVAIHGLLVLLVPRSRLMTTATAVRSGLVWLLVLALLFVVRLPGMAKAFAAYRPWLRWAPPAWFVGLERWLLGDPHMAPLAFLAVVAFALAAAVSVGAYAILYQRFDRTTVRPSGVYSPRRVAGGRVPGRRAVRRAIATFAGTTLRRSMLHQGIVVALCAAGAGLVVNGLIVSGLPSPRTSTWMVCWAPFALICIACPAVRLALSVPLELRANWIFRMTEERDTRPDVVGAGLGVVVRLGVVAPVAAMLPLQWLAVGAWSLALALVELAAGWLLAELLMMNWRRIPFTCSYIPGKGFVPHMFVRGVVFFLVFTNVGARLLQLGIAVPTAVPIVVAIVSAPAVLLRVRRRRRAEWIDLTFEDELPGEISPLRLNS